MKRKQNKKINLEYIIYIFAFIFLTIPRSIETVAPRLYDCINLVKIVITIVIGVMFLKRKNKLSSLTKLMIIYSIYLFFITIINKVNPVTVTKVYGLNISIFVLLDSIFSSEYKNKFIKFFSNYFMVLLTTNLTLILISMGLGNETGQICETYLLGQDNRFILYLIPTIIGFYYLSKYENNNKNRIKLYISYLIGTYTLYILWSVASLAVMLLIGFGSIIIKKIKKINIEIHLSSLFIVSGCIGVVFFKIQNYFSYIIVNILHKSMTLSYRTIIWDRAIDMLTKSKLNMIIGFGYFDTSYLFMDIMNKLNHLHNLILDPLFSGGIIGLTIYIIIYHMVIKQINTMKKTEEGNILSIIFSMILLLLIFDTYEAYQVYYFSIYLLYILPGLLKKEHERNNSIKYKKTTNDNKKLAILLATYNGEKYITEQLDSIINQTYQNWVLYVSDDHSTDKTMKILKKYKNRYKNKIIIVENENKLSSAKLNFANVFNKVDNFDYYIFCDQDDVWLKDKLSKMVYTMKESEKSNENIPLLVYTDTKIVDKDLNVINDSLIRKEEKFLPNKNIVKHLLLEAYFPGCTTMFNHELKEKVKSIYDKCEMHDWWVAQVAALTGKIIYMDESLHLYRQHESNTIGAGKENNKLEKYLVRIKKLFNFNKMHKTWKLYQKTILIQAEELKRRYKSEPNIDIKSIDEFISIMKTKNKFKRLILLAIKGYVPREKIRILRLVI